MVLIVKILLTCPYKTKAVLCSFTLHAGVAKCLFFLTVFLTGCFFFVLYFSKPACAGKSQHHEVSHVPVLLHCAKFSLLCRSGHGRKVSAPKIGHIQHF